MDKQEKHSKSKSSPERLTLYVKPEHRELVQWAQEYTQAASVSEAIFAALADLKLLVRERQLQALDDIHGIWKDDPRIDDALKDLEEGRETWRKRVEEY